MTEDKLYLFLEQEVVNRKSQASGYQTQKAKRREIWEDSKRAKKRRKTAELAAAEGQEENEGVKEEEKMDEVLDSLFNEMVQYSVVNSSISAITELYT